jgi:hypothetical protein
MAISTLFPSQNFRFFQKIRAMASEAGVGRVFKIGSTSLPQVKNSFGVTRANFLDSLYADRLAIQTRQAA